MAVSIKPGTCGGIGYTTTGSLTFFHPALCFGVDKFKCTVRLWNRANFWDPTSCVVLQSHQIAEAGVVRLQCWDSVFPKCAI